MQELRSSGVGPGGRRLVFGGAFALWLIVETDRPKVSWERRMADRRNAATDADKNQ